MSKTSKASISKNQQHLNHLKSSILSKTHRKILARGFNRPIAMSFSFPGAWWLPFVAFPLLEAAAQKRCFGCPNKAPTLLQLRTKEAAATSSTLGKMETSAKRGNKWRTSFYTDGQFLMVCIQISPYIYS